LVRTTFAVVPRTNLSALSSGISISTSRNVNNYDEILVMMQNRDAEERITMITSPSTRALAWVRILGDISIRYYLIINSF
jgi:hypothetical protein